ncbi:MAG: acetate kinase [Candidatus Woesearchaeota archaeon]|nr:MAG: acetate kinase [Candidatus Woesearchaeota archaeon]
MVFLLLLLRGECVINPSHYFILKNGGTIKSLEELISVLKNIDKETFEYHVNKEKNDFSNWIRYVFKLKKLSDSIFDFTYSERDEIIKAIQKHLNEHKFLIINSGSSSIKFQIIEMTSRQVLLKGIVDAIGLENSSLKLFGEKTIEKNIMIKNHEEGIKTIINELLSSESLGCLDEIKAIIHRVVHGGELFSEPTIINDESLEKIESLSNIAPLHNPYNVVCIKAFRKMYPDVKQIAVFDTAFHSTIQKEKFLYGIPIKFYEQYGIRKYGFHGSSHKYIATLMQDYYKIKKKRNPKYIICHLGNGCSITAIKNGKSFNTSMGFTPTDGLIMGTRSGSLDPYIAVHLEKTLNIGYDDLGIILNKKSGLLGISGYSDMRKILENINNQDCKLALDMFIDRIVHYIGAYTAELNGIDGIVFTGGIGENSDYIRKKVIENFKFLGIKLDNKKNKSNDFIITSKGSKIECFVIKTNEELQMAIEAKELLNL